jgi:nucleoside-triphosphatase
MHVILTGTRQVGKSTVCRKIATALQDAGHRVGGVWTETIVHGGERTLMAHDLGKGEQVLLASTAQPGSGVRQGPFIFAPEGLFAAIRAIGNGMTSDLLVIDEIGPLEMRGQGFAPVLHTVGRAAHTLLVIRTELLDTALVRLRLGHDFEVIEVVPAHRDELAERLATRLGDAIVDGAS